MAVEGTHRRGVALGLVLARGHGDFDVTQNGATAQPGWSSGGNVVRGRIGLAVTPELVLSAEYGVWRREIDDSSTASDGGTDGGAAGGGGTTATTTSPDDRYLGMGLVAISLYPRLGGFFLRGGLGYGRAFAQVQAEGATLRGDGKGPVLLLGLGYEVFVDDDLSIALNADFGRIEGGREISGAFAQLGATFSLYLPDGFLREWF